ncbi:MAG: CarD family transcriptional regulator [Eubacterium sp.]
MTADKINVGDYVVYSTKGICRVENIETKNFDRENRNYFVFVPVFDTKSTYFIPVDYDSSRVHIKTALTGQEAKALMEFAENTDPAEWIANSNERKQVYDNLYKTGTREQIIKVIKAIKKHENNQKALGKQLYATDDRILKGCVNLICGELAFVLDKNPEEIKEQLCY